MTAPPLKPREILWHCLTKRVLYDETVHVANRNRALGRAA
jgi:hypothetical protein